MPKGATKDNPAFDRQAAFAHISILHPTVYGFVEILAVSSKRPDDARTLFETTVLRATIGVELFATRPEHAHRNILVGVASRRVQRGTNQDLGRVSCVWADVDMRTPAERVERLRRARKLPRPTLIVRTSDSGEHWYWCSTHALDLSTSPGHLRSVRHINRSIAETLGLDPSAATSPHTPLKVAGTLNRKPGRDDCLVTIAEYHPERVTKWTHWHKRFGSAPRVEPSAPLVPSESGVFGLAELCARFDVTSADELQEEDLKTIPFSFNVLPDSVETLRRRDPYVDGLFKRCKKFPRDSHGDFALCCALAKHGVRDVCELASACAVSRERAGLERKRDAFHVRTAAHALAAVLRSQTSTSEAMNAEETFQ